jgi:hypothetical protein
VPRRRPADGRKGKVEMEKKIREKMSGHERKRIE